MTATPISLTGDSTLRAESNPALVAEFGSLSYGDVDIRNDGDFRAQNNGGGHIVITGDVNKQGNGGIWFNQGSTLTIGGGGSLEGRRMEVNDAGTVVDFGAANVHITTEELRIQGGGAAIIGGNLTKASGDKEFKVNNGSYLDASNTAAGSVINAWYFEVHTGNATQPNTYVDLGDADVAVNERVYIGGSNERFSECYIGGDLTVTPADKGDAIKLDEGLLDVGGTTSAHRIEIYDNGWLQTGNVVAVRDEVYLDGNNALLSPGNRDNPIGTMTIDAQLNSRRVRLNNGAGYRWQIGPNAAAGVAGVDYDTMTLVLGTKLEQQNRWQVVVAAGGGTAQPGDTFTILTYDGATVDPLTNFNDANIGVVIAADAPVWWDASGASVSNVGNTLELTGLYAPAGVVSNVVAGDWTEPASWDAAQVPSANVVGIVRDGHTITVDLPGQSTAYVGVQDGGTLVVAAAGGLDLPGPVGILDVAPDVGNGGGVLTVEDGGTLTAREVNTAGTTVLDTGPGTIGTLNVTGGSATVGTRSIGTLNVIGGVVSAADATITEALVIPANRESIAVSNGTTGMGVTDAGSGVTLGKTLSLRGGTIAVAANSEFAPPPAIWTDAKIGAGLDTGSWAHAGGVHTINASGRDFWDAEDGGYFVYKEFDATDVIDISAQVGVVDGFQGGDNGWAKAGLMIRQSLNTNSPNVMELIARGDGEGINPQIRKAEGGTDGTDNTGPRINPGPMRPVWLRLTYDGANSFKTYYKDNEADPWIEHSNDAFMSLDAGFELSGTILAGMAVTAHDPGQTTQVRFADVFGFGAPAIDIPTTTLVLDADTIVALGKAGAAAFGGVYLGSGNTLTVTADTPISVTFTDVVGSGSIGGPGLGGVIITGSAAPGSSVGVLNVEADVTLADGSTFDADVHAGGVDMIETSESVTISADASLNLLVAGGGNEFTVGKYILIIDTRGEGRSSHLASWRVPGSRSINRDGLARPGRRVVSELWLNGPGEGCMMRCNAVRGRAGRRRTSAMIQCEDCEFFHLAENGEVGFSCDPFKTVKEPECLAKWQLLKTNQMVASYQATLNYYQKLAPMQEKMFKVMEREIDDMSESDKWKVADDGDEEILDDGPGEDQGDDLADDLEEHWGS